MKEKEQKIEDDISDDILEWDFEDDIEIGIDTQEETLEDKDEIEEAEIQESESKAIDNETKEEEESAKKEEEEAVEETIEEEGNKSNEEVDEDSIPKKKKVGRYTRAEKIMFIEVVIVTLLAVTATGMLCSGYKNQTDNAKKRYEGIQKEDSELRANMSNRESLIHKMIPGGVVTGEGLQSFKKTFGSEYTIKVIALDGKDVTTVDKDKTYEVISKVNQDNKFIYTFKESTKVIGDGQPDEVTTLASPDTSKEIVDTEETTEEAKTNATEDNKVKEGKEKEAVEQGSNVEKTKEESNQQVSQVSTKEETKSTGQENAEV